MNRLLNLLVAVTFVSLFSMPVAAIGNDFDPMDIDGPWDVVSTNWTGDPTDFEGSVFRFRIDPESMVSDVNLSTFTAGISLMGGFFVVNHTFCAVREARLGNNIDFFRGYDLPLHWLRDDYPCFDESFETDGLGRDRMFMRFLLDSQEDARVLFYYDLVESVPEPEVRCTGSSCWKHRTVGAGIFELILKKRQ